MCKKGGGKEWKRRQWEQNRSLTFRYQVPKLNPAETWREGHTERAYIFWLHTTAQIVFSALHLYYLIWSTNQLWGNNYHCLHFVEENHHQVIRSEQLCENDGAVLLPRRDYISEGVWMSRTGLWVLSERSAVPVLTIPQSYCSERRSASRARSY